jgi:sodium transport system permease protein
VEFEAKAMRWSIIWVIFRREVRDQVRDRRTLFMIFVLPILLYPILGFTILQLSTAFEQKPRTVVVLGAERLPSNPSLLDPRGDRFARELFSSEAEESRLIVDREPATSAWGDPAKRGEALRSGKVDAVLVIPPDIGERIDQVKPIETPIIYNSVNEQSQLTYLRLREVLRRWNDEIVAARLVHDNKPESYTEPVQAPPTDVATGKQAGRNVWSRLFPFLLIIMSLTGAFYPAIDICAGEKERGTMETLLISPASRGEIVMGKFFTVLLASVLTAFLNLVSMGLTGFQLARRMSALAKSVGPGAADVIAPPSLVSSFWMVLLLIPPAAFFSAVCIALAVLAKSMKEGQYYMTPLYLISLPLIFLTLAPGVSLDPFYSLVPITGVSLLLRAIMQGDFVVARRYFLPVLIPTCVYGVLALRWAIDQFQREDVLFREAEKFDLKGWIVHLFRDKEETPGPGMALLCFVLMLSSAWFLIQWLADTSPRSMVISQVGFVLAPPLLLALLLTSSPRRTLKFYAPKIEYIAISLGLAIAIHPWGSELASWVEWIFPIPEEIRTRLGAMTANIKNPLTLLTMFAIVPGICEEIAFRGFILSGLQNRYRNVTAIVLSALLFGFLHVLLSLSQQAFNATLLGLLLGLIAVRSGSVLPGIVFHVTHNGLAVMMSKVKNPSLSTWLYRDTVNGLYQKHWLALGLAVMIVLIGRLIRNGSDRSNEAAEATDKFEAELVESAR